MCRSTLPSDPERGGPFRLMLGTFGLGSRCFAMTKSRGLWFGVRTDQPGKGINHVASHPYFACCIRYRWYRVYCDYFN